MSDSGAHSLVSGIAAVAVHQTAAWPFMGEAAIVFIVSLGLHLPVDMVPHGHTRRRWVELLVGGTLTLFVLSFSWLVHGPRLFWLVFVGVTAGNAFDVLLLAAQRRPDEKWARWLLRFNYDVHWFSHRTEFFSDFDIHHQDWSEQHRGRQVRVWRYGWYNLLFDFVCLVVYIAIMLF